MMYLWQVNRTLLAGALGIVALVIVLALYQYYAVAPNIPSQKIKWYNKKGNLQTVNSTQHPKMIVFSASWCGNCRDELKSINAQPNLDSSRVWVLSEESWNAIDKLKAIAPRLNYGKLATSLSQLKIHSIPSIYFFNSRSQIIKKHTGNIRWEDYSNREHFFKLLQIQ